jgi:hypothetical protein
MGGHTHHAWKEHNTDEISEAQKDESLKKIRHVRGASQGWEKRRQLQGR